MALLKARKGSALQESPSPFQGWAVGLLHCARRGRVNVHEVSSFSLEAGSLAAMAREA